MFGLGFQELLILLIIGGPIVGVVVATKRRKVVHVAAGLGFLQGLANVAFGVLGGPPGYTAQDRLEASIAVVWMLAQGVAMIVFAIATYRRKLYGAYGLLVVALLYAVLSLVEKGTPGWIIPPLIYLGGVLSLHRARRTSPAAQAS